MSIFASDIADPTIITKTKTKVEKPKKYHVVFLNDDFTPMDFVVLVLMEFFHKNSEEAMTIMLEIHHNGRGIAGTYTYEIAEQKAYETMNAAKNRNHPLKVIIEEAND